MKRYSIRKITIRTREIVSSSSEATVSEEMRNKAREPICPVCHTPIAGNKKIGAETSTVSAG